MADPLSPAPDAGLDLELTRGVVLGYAEAAADFNSIHMSDEAARKLGFSGAIAHGMLTLGWAVMRLLERRGSTLVTAVEARFAAPVPVGARVHLEINGDVVDSISARALLEDGTLVLTVRMNFGAVPTGEALAPDAEIVAERMLQVDQEVALRFARAVGAGDGIYTSVVAAKEAGFPAMPMVPTIAFALAELGFLPDDPANAGASVPDSVGDSQAWAQTTQPVVHAEQSFVFHHHLLVGERVLARTAITGRSSRRNASGTVLRFTKVRTVFESTDGTPISTSDTNLVVIGD